MRDPLQYPLPFSPPFAWWVRRFAEQELDAAIDQALALAAQRALEPLPSCVAPRAAAMATDEYQLWLPLLQTFRPTIVRRVPEYGAQEGDAGSLDGSLVTEDADDGEDHPITNVEDAMDALTGHSVPRDPTVAWAQLDLIVEGLRERGVSGHESMLRRLAILASPAYRGQGFGPRILITAPPGAGKTFLLSALAESVSLPSLHIDASIITPEGWSGTNVSELIGKRVGAAPGQYPLSTWQRGAVLVLDEIDKACRASPDDRHGTAVRLERQHTMLGLVWGGTPIRLADGAEIKTDRWIIAACGAFASSRFVAERRPPTDDELVAWGMSAELASRFPTRLVLAPMGVPELIERLRTDPRGLALATQLATAFGMTLVVPDATLARLAVATAERPASFSVRAASAALVQAVVERLAHTRRDDAGGPIVIAPDDVEVPRRQPVPRDEGPPEGPSVRYVP
jgi:hypothetical protein